MKEARTRQVSRLHALLCACAVSPCAAQDAPSALERGHRAYRALDVASAASSYREALTSDAISAEQRARAGQLLIRLAGRVDGDLAAARAVAERLGEVERATPLWLELGFVEADAGHFDRALRAVRTAIDAAVTEIDRVNAELALARVIAEQAAVAARAGREVDAASTREALAALGRIRRRFPEDTRVPEVELFVALLARQGAVALRAWHDHFQLAPTDSAPAHLAAARDRLAPALRSLGRRRLDAARQIDLVLGLADSRLFDHAAIAIDLLGLDVEVTGGRVRDVHAYVAFLAEVEAITYGLYRATIRAGEQTRDLQRAYERDHAAAYRRLWKALSPRGTSTAYDRDAFRRELFGRFGTVLLEPSYTSGYLGSYGGHVHADETTPVEQYGHRVEVRFITLDSTIATDLFGWLRDPRDFFIGGWARWSDSTAVHVRRSYYNRPPLVWNRLSDAEALVAWREEIAQQRADDERRAARQPVAYLPGLQSHLRLETYDRLLSGLRAEGLTGDALRRGFVARIAATTFHGSIVLHEGRHVIDNTLPGKLDAAAREFRAKLSEVALSEHPRWQLALNVLTPSLGGDDPHGRANERLVRGLVEWMESNGERIRGLARDRPLLPQLARLTDDQLRAAARAMDPLAR